MIFIINKLGIEIKWWLWRIYPHINKNDSMAFGTYIINAVNGLELNLLNYLLNGKILKGIVSGNSVEERSHKRDLRWGLFTCSDDLKSRMLRRPKKYYARYKGTVQKDMFHIIASYETQYQEFYIDIP